MSEWITHRPPTEDDADYEKCVWTMCDGKAVLWGYAQIREGQPWMPTNRPEPYVKLKRYTVKALRDTILETTWYEVWDNLKERNVAIQITSREAAERIAAIYEEVMP